MLHITSPQHIVDLSKKLMSLPSFEDDIKAQKKCIDLLAKTFKKDFHTRVYTFKGHPALVMSTTKKKKVDLIFSGHIDVVAAPEKLFSPQLKGDKLFGRGAYDMKAALVSCVYAARDYRAAGGTQDIAIMITTDEEVSGYSTQQLLEKHGYRARFAFIPDGGYDAGVVLRQKGFAQFKVVFNGKSAHASEQWNGDNPIGKVHKLCRKIESVFPGPKKKDQWQTSVVPTRLETHGSLNQIPEHATVYFDVRYVQDQDLKKVSQLLKKEVGKKGKVEMIAQNGMFKAEEKNPYVQVLLSVLQGSTQKKVSFMYENGTSDAIFFTEHGVPAALYRPVGGGAHQDGEWVSVKSLYDMYRVMSQFLLASLQEQ